MFDDYIAVSPNCCYDEYRLVTDIENHQFKNRKAPRFIYASMSGEIDNGSEYWGDDWKAGWERVSTFLKDNSHFNENTVTSVHTFPGYGHYNGFMPSVTAALNDYIVFGAKNLVGYGTWRHKESDTAKILTLLVSRVWEQSEFGAGLFLISLDNRMTYAAACIPLPSPHTQT